MTTKKLYVIYCNDETKYIEGVSESTPTGCFHDDGHTIDTNKTKELEYPVMPVRLMQTYINGEDTDNYYLKTIYDTIPPETTKDILFPFKFDNNMYGVYITTSKGNIGDTYDTYLNKDTLVGGVTQSDTDVSIIEISPTAIPYFKPGLFVKFGSSEYFQVIAVGSTNITIDGTITVTAGDLCYLTYYLLRNKHILREETQILGSTIIGSSRIQAGWVGGITYYNSSKSEKKIEVSLELTF